MKDIYQVVVQQKTNSVVRAIVQFDADGTDQKVVTYDSLTDEQKKTWDAFIAMLNPK